MKKKVFVIGAGASNEVNMPLGKALIGQIAEKLDFDFDDFERQIKGSRTIMESINQEGENGVA